MGCCFSGMDDKLKPLLTIPDIPEDVFVSDIPEDVFVSDTSEDLLKSIMCNHKNWRKS
jgi:hypothetical protein